MSITVRSGPIPERKDVTERIERLKKEQDERDRRAQQPQANSSVRQGAPSRS